jgi:hypothetical protein
MTRSRVRISLGPPGNCLLICFRFIFVVICICNLCKNKNGGRFMDDFVEFSKRISLLEVATLKIYPESRLSRDGRIHQVQYKTAYAKKLEDWFPFNCIKWDQAPFLNFRVLKEFPPKFLIEKDNELCFDENFPTVNNWEDFIDSFRQLRNNLVHGAKFLHEMKLEDRDKVLITAGLTFIKFLEGEGHDKGSLIHLH